MAKGSTTRNRANRTRTPAATATSPTTRATDGAKADQVDPSRDLNKADTGAADRTATQPDADQVAADQARVAAAAAAAAGDAEAQAAATAAAAAAAAQGEKDAAAALAAAEAEAAALAAPTGRQRTFHVLRRHDGDGVSYGTEVDAAANPGVAIETTRKAAPSDVDHLVRLGVLGTDKPKATQGDRTSMVSGRPADTAAE